MHRAERTANRATLDAPTAQAVDEVFGAFQDRNRSPGMSYGIVLGGRVVHAGATGVAHIGGSSMHARSVLRVASMTKSFTAAVVLLLRDEGRLRLDEPVATYIPELIGMRLPTPDSPVLTMRMLLTMSAGLPTDDPWADREESMGSAELSELLAAGLSFSSIPGTDFQYSNLGYVIAGRVIANVTGQCYHDVVRDRLLQPLGLHSTGFALADVPADDVVPGHHRLGDAWCEEPFADPGEFSPLGGLFSSVEDLAVWVAGFADAHDAGHDADDDAGDVAGDVADQGHPLCRASRREMQQLQRFIDVTVPQTQPGVPPVRARASGYGFGLVVSHDTRWGQIAGHSGGYPGYGSHMRWHLATGTGVVALGNGRYVPAGEPASLALELVLTSRHAPSRRVTRWARSREVQRAAQSLLVRWDDAVADAIFAANVDRDLPRERRRAALEAAAQQLGPVSGDEDPAPVSASAADIAWWVSGANGRVRMYVQLTPQATPLVQTLTVAFVGAVSPQLAAVAGNAAASLGPADADVEVECVEWRSAHDATFRIRSGVDQWRAVLAVDPASGEVTSHRVTPTPPSSIRFDDIADSPVTDAPVTDAEVLDRE